MKKCVLGDVADVIVSGVDKKTKDGEEKVRLCNYTDVYYNWAITSAKHDGLMEASAKPEEIRKFKIRKGQVALTKDSETRDDIGIPTYIADDFEDVILGYHCALITPYDKQLDGSYLNALLRTKYAKEFFANNAGGSGQRYYLSDASIKELPLFLPDFAEQKRIGKFFSSIDRKIALNRKRIATLEGMAKEIYDYWFVQFDFPDAHGCPYKSSGGAMVYNPDLKREIPKGWEVGRLADIAQYSKEAVRSDAIDIKHYVTTDSLLQGKKGRVQAANLPPVPVSLVAFQKDDTLVANIRPYLKKIWYATESGGSSQDVLVFHPICGELAPLLHSILWQDDFFDYVMAAAKGSKMPRGDKAHIMDYPIPLPDKKVARRFGESVEKFYAWCECALKETESLISLRDFLLPVLMNGQVKVG